MLHIVNFKINARTLNYFKTKEINYLQLLFPPYAVSKKQVYTKVIQIRFKIKINHLFI